MWRSLSKLVSIAEMSESAVNHADSVCVDGSEAEEDLYWTLGPIKRQCLWLIKGLKRAGLMSSVLTAGRERTRKNKSLSSL